MATIIADNIISPLGSTSMTNYLAVKSHRSALLRHEATERLPFAYTASLFIDAGRKALEVEGSSTFESLVIRSVSDALATCHIPLGSRTALLISSTKANVGMLSITDNPDYVVSPGVSALRIARALGVEATPIVVSNACISGVAAMILGERLVDTGAFDYAIVCGADVQNPFIISGFQSLKALSETQCRPFDIERLGLNLGEAAATVIMQRDDDSSHHHWRLLRGAVRNDAHHITNPSPAGAGCALAIESALADTDRSILAQVNAHGTATMYNDQMESKAVSAAALSDIPLNALKGYIGHTMGAAGIVETVLTMHALDDATIIGTLGFEETGVSGKVTLSADNTATDKKAFLKIISGFGGCNAAALFDKGDTPASPLHAPQIQQTHSVSITPDSVEVDGRNIPVSEKGLKLLTSIYKQKGIDYPKFYKMDPLARLAFVATELLLEAEGAPRFVPRDDRAVIFFNSKGSYHADIEYLRTISDPANYFPSPSLFVYTLPNIAAGEVAIYNKYRGETAFYVLPAHDPAIMHEVLKATFADATLKSAVAGWLEYTSPTDFVVRLTLIAAQSPTDPAPILDPSTPRYSR